MNKVLSLAIAALLLNGCASAVNTYNPKSLPSENLATVRGTELDMKFTFGVSDKIFSRIAWVYDKNGKRIIDRGWNNTWGLEEVKLEPGFYIFAIYCGQGNLYATPQVAFKLEANKEYIASCEKGGDIKDFFAKAKAAINEIK